MRSRKELISLLNKIENELNTPAWKVNDLNIWPLLRIQIAFQWYSLHENFNANSDASKPRKPNSTLTKIKTKISNTVIGFITLKNLLSADVDFLFFGNQSHRVMFNKESMNRFFDPLMDELTKSRKKCLLCEDGVKRDVYKNDRTIDFSKIVIGLLWIFNLFNKTRNNKTNFRISDFEKLKEKLKLEKISINEYNTINNEQYLNFIKYIIKLIGKKNPKLKAVFFLCYYSHFTTLYAFNNIGIKTVDFQHGPITDFHPAYGNWKNIAKKGYNTMPSHFWCWDTNSANTINRWSENLQTHKAFVGGHTWIDFCKLNADKVERNNKKNLLYSLQPDIYLWPQWLLLLFVKLQEKYNLLFRLHPRMQETTNEIESFLKKNGIQNPNVKEATQTPLPLILAQTDINITNYSGVIIEADLFNIQTLLIDKRGKDNFQYYIDKGMAAYVDENSFEENLKFFLKKDKGVRGFKETPDYLSIIEKNILY